MSLLQTELANTRNGGILVTITGQSVPRAGRSWGLGAHLSPLNVRGWTGRSSEFGVEHWALTQWPVVNRCAAPVPAYQDLLRTALDSCGLRAAPGARGKATECRVGESLDPAARPGGRSPVWAAVELLQEQGPCRVRGTSWGTGWLLSLASRKAPL